MRIALYLFLALAIFGCSSQSPDIAEPATVLVSAAPAYPLQAKRLGIEGFVRLRIQIGADGTVGRVEVAESTGNALLEAAAIEAARKSKYQAARTRAGQSVETWLLAPYRFILTSGPVKQSSSSIQSELPMEIAQFRR